MRRWPAWEVSAESAQGRQDLSEPGVHVGRLLDGGLPEAHDHGVGGRVHQDPLGLVPLAGEDAGLRVPDPPVGAVDAALVI